MNKINRKILHSRKQGYTSLNIKDTLLKINMIVISSLHIRSSEQDKQGYKSKYYGYIIQIEYFKVWTSNNLQPK